mmetsp:Transcript_119030/g.370790  ORF Transcript_119030/g.370790 Transcript_119030/m.370790 type:complete len:305 (+) Transcript_119030:641-1555(+)
MEDAGAKDAQDRVQRARAVGGPKVVDVQRHRHRHLGPRRQRTQRPADPRRRRGGDGGERARRLIPREVPGPGAPRRSGVRGVHRLSGHQLQIQTAEHAAAAVRGLPEGVPVRRLVGALDGIVEEVATSLWAAGPAAGARRQRRGCAAGCPIAAARGVVASAPGAPILRHHDQAHGRGRWRERATIAAAVVLGRGRGILPPGVQRPCATPGVSAGTACRAQGLGVEPRGQTATGARGEERGRPARKQGGPAAALVRGRGILVLLLGHRRGIDRSAVVHLGATPRRQTQRPRLLVLRLGARPQELN